MAPILDTQKGIKQSIDDKHDKLIKQLEQNQNQIVRAIENLDVAILAGTPFMEANDVAVRPAKREVLLGNGSIYTNGSKTPSTPLPNRT